MYLTLMKKKKILVNLMVVAILGFLTTTFSGCGSTRDTLAISEKEKQAFATTDEEPVTIANDEVEYEIIIIEPGFHTWLNSVARPEGYYSKTFLESRNTLMVLEWNRRAMQPNRFNPDLYSMQIDYQQGIDYGYEVNYKLYNYFIFFQRKYNQRLGAFVPRI